MVEVEPSSANDDINPNLPAPPDNNALQTAPGGNSSTNAAQGLHRQDNLSEQFKDLLKKLQPSDNNFTLEIDLKLNEQNYSLWARLMRVAIGGRGRLSHITSVPAPPQPTDPEFHSWEQSGLSVCLWILHNMDLKNYFAEYPTASELWKGIATTYGSGGDSLQIYDLTVRASNQRQGDRTLEQLFSGLQQVWREIERRQPNPMTCVADIATINKMRQDTRLFQFLAAVNDEFDGVHRDLLKSVPLPSAEMTYAAVRREAARIGIFTMRSVAGSDTSPGSGLAVQGRNDRSKSQKPNTRDSGVDKSTLWCTDCKKSGHNLSGCFKRIGNPEWWLDMKKWGTKPGAATCAVSGTDVDTITDTGRNPLPVGFGGIIVNNGAASSSANEGGVAEMFGYQDESDNWAWH